ncbi:hypothetical protein DCC35_02900 [Mangrovivirga cuniculi]|uniref:Uncharacterized protein n=1 Tax=Mangrovivirga cuniculi TaxID=2715131 RepID=A0A4D7JBL8_9BACT|nr:hypothetical protein DCC35_02900 [Mangrovivirga cuniculi]
MLKPARLMRLNNKSPQVLTEDLWFYVLLILLIYFNHVNPGSNSSARVMLKKQRAPGGTLASQVKF